MSGCDEIISEEMDLLCFFFFLSPSWIVIPLTQGFTFGFFFFLMFGRFMFVFYNGNMCVKNVYKSFTFADHDFLDEFS